MYNANQEVKDLGLEIRRGRVSLGWTLDDLSAKCGVSVGTLSKIENNQHSPRFATFSNIMGSLRTGRSSAGIGTQADFGGTRSGSVVARWLTPAETITQLPFRGSEGNEEISLNRLIALGELEIVTLGGPDGPMRISDVSLNDFISRAAPNLNLPANDGKWFNENKQGLEWACGELTNSIISGLASQVPANLTGIKVERGSVDDITLKSTPAIDKLLKAAPPADVGTGKPSRFASNAELYLVDRIRGFAFQQTLTADESRMGGMPYLYSSVDTFNAVVKVASDRLKSSGLFFSKTYSYTPADTAPGAWRPNGPPQPTTQTVSFKFPDALILKFADLGRVIQLAF